MHEQATVLVENPHRDGRGAPLRASSSWSLLVRRWDVALLLVATAGAAVAVWLSLRADFLTHPALLAVQKADFILGPIAVGLYWRHRRPGNRLGLLLIALGACGIPYILASSSAPVLFGFGVWWEFPIVVLTEAVILAFPSGRLDGRVERAILAVLVLSVGATYTVAVLTVSPLGPSFSLSGCRAACPANGLAIWSPPSWIAQLVDTGRAGVSAVAIATICLLAWRFMTATPPRRRSLAVGTPIALLFLLAQATFQTLSLFTPTEASASAGPVKGVIIWISAGTRSAVWYGFLFALIAAGLFAGRTLTKLVSNSLGRPSFRELEGMLRRPLGDPGLRLGFWRDPDGCWVDADDAPLARATSGQRLTPVRRDGHPVVAIVHDEQLVEDPELLRAAGAVALLALENAELDAAWKRALRALGASRARLTKASDRERRKLERDLHDGAQQRLLAALIKLASAEEGADGDPELARQLTAARVQLEAAIEELRDLAHGIYPTVLAEVGLAGALRDVALRSPDRVTVSVTERRFSPEIEAALYYCCLEAVQNAFKHGGAQAQISIRLFADEHDLRLEVRDLGSGFDMADSHGGLGMQSMEDRLGAVGGHVRIESAPGHGTVVSADAPVGAAEPPQRPAAALAD